MNEATVDVFAIGNCESCMWPISTNPTSMEAGVYGLTHEMCLVARRLEVVAVAGLLWISWCVWVGGIFWCVCVCVFFSFLFSSNVHGLLQVKLPCLIYLSTRNESRPRERSGLGRFLPLGKKASSCTGVRTGCHYLICLSVCMCACV